MFKHVLVATDGTPHARRAIELALKVAEGARVSALLVVPDYGTAEFAQAFFTQGPDAQGLRRQLAEHGQRRLGDELARYGAAADHVQRLVAVSDTPYEEILRTAEREQCDVIVMARRSRGPISSALLGSQTLRTLALSKVPVLVAVAEET